MSNKHASDIIYALADYKQLVLAYKTKHAELVRAVSFWKTSLIWFAVLTLVVAGIAGAGFLQNKKACDENMSRIHSLNENIASLSARLEKAEKELRADREELGKKEAMIKLLEKNISTTSKKLLEQLLSEQESVPQPH